MVRPSSQPPCQAVLRHLVLQPAPAGPPEPQAHNSACHCSMLNTLLQALQVKSFTRVRRMTLCDAQLARQAVLGATQHEQSGQQSTCWLESAWPFVSLNLPQAGQYLPLNIVSLSSCAAATGQNLLSSLQSKLNLNWLQKFKFKFLASIMIPIISSFKVLSQIKKLKFKISRGYKFGIPGLSLHVHWQARAVTLG